MIDRSNCLCWRLIAVCGAMLTFSIGSYSQAEQLTSGTSSQKARQSVLSSIPYQQLNEEARLKINPVLSKPSIYRRLPVTSIEVDPDYFVFLVRYPEVVVNIWKIMGVTKMVTTRRGPFEIVTDDGAGTVSNVELIYGTNNMHIFYAEGTYEGPVLKRKLKGKCVLVLRSDYGQNGPHQTATSQLDVFLKVDNATAGLIAKTVNPIVGKTADHNFVESLNFIQRLNETTEKNGPGVQHMANRLADISRDVRRDFVHVAGRVYEKSTGMSVSTPAAQFGEPAYQARPATRHPSAPRLDSGRIPARNRNVNPTHPGYSGASHAPIPIISSSRASQASAWSGRVPATNLNDLGMPGRGTTYTLPPHVSQRNATASPPRGYQAPHYPPGNSIRR